MKVTELKQRLAAGDASIGSWLTAPGATMAAAMASCGFDWLAIDMEHGTTGVDQAQDAFMAMERYGSIPLVRLPSADPFLARRLLDAGAGGLIVPVVEDAEHFKEFANHCLYPPNGRRGVGLSRCNRWGDRFEEYLTDFQPLLVAQIETTRGVKAAKNIAALPMVDALFLGPYDLSADLGCGGDFTTSAYQESLDRFLSQCQESGKAAGIHQVTPDVSALRQRLDEGFRFVAFSTDIIAMRTTLKAVFAQPRKKP